MILLCVLLIAEQRGFGQESAWFSSKDAALEQAIDADSVDKLHQALAQGANVNAKGRVGVTPLEYALGHFKKATFAELLKLQANRNQKDDEGDNTITLAVRAYDKDPQYLELALDAKGNPNTARPDGDPIMMSFVGTSHMDAIKLLAKHGANVNAKTRDGFSMVQDMALSQDWDAVWTLLQLGAKYDLTGPYTWVKPFSGKSISADATVAPDVKHSWEFLTAHGVQIPPLEFRH